MAYDTTKQPRLIQSYPKKGMALDPLKSMQPNGFSREVLNGVIENEESNGFGLSSEPSNELLSALPEGNIRGMHFVEERDHFYTFLHRKGHSEIGYVDVNTRQYVKVFDSCQENLNFGEECWTPIVSKILQPCNQLHLYWANCNDTYFRLNVDDTTEVEEGCGEIFLFQPQCLSNLEITVTEQGGVDLQGGAYDIVAQLEDIDGNVTNWFNFGKTVYLGTENNTSDEVSDHGIHIEISDLGDNYEKVNLAVFHNGNTTGTQIASLPYNSSGVDFFYNSTSQHLGSVPLADVLTRNNGYPRGSDLQQYDGRLFLYNVRGERNIDYQRRALQIKPSYVIGRVPMKYSHLFKGLRGNENYAVFIHWNFTDGTRTRAFHITNVDGSPESGEDCDGCGGTNAGNGARRSPMTNGQSSVEDDSAGYVRDIQGTSEEYQEFVPTEQNIYTEEDADFPDYSDVPLPSSGGDDCDCQVICLLADNARRVINASLLGLESKIAIKFPFPIVGADFNNPADTQDILAAYKLKKKECECNCDEEVTPRSTSSDPSPTFNDSDVARLQKQLELQAEVEAGTVSGTTVQEYLELFYTYDSSGDGLEATLRSSIDSQSDSFPGTSSENPDPGNCFKPGEDTGTTDPYSSGGETGGEDNPEPADDGGEVESRSVGDPTPTSETQPSGKICDKDTTTGGDREPLDNFSSSATNEPSAPADNGSGRGLATESDEVRSDDLPENECEPEIIFEDDECCKVKKIIPCIDAVGELGTYESCDTYPLDKNCDGEYLYGDLAGKPIKHLQMPDRAEEPHSISYHDGVPSSDNRDNHEAKNAYARFIWLKLDNIVPPDEDELDKPLCKDNPFTISIIKRDEANKTVIGSGLLRPTFEGDIYGEKHLFPKHGVSSSEYYSRWIENTSGDWRREGERNTDTPAYTFLSPDTQFDEPNINADRLDMLQNVKGKGYRHGLYAEGIDPDGMFVGPKHTKGARQSMNLNRFTTNKRQRCIKAAAYAGADQIVDKSDRFSKSLVNLSRESSVYIETEGGYIDLEDGSFFGDVNQHRRVLEGEGLYADIVRDLPNQYGRLENAPCVPLYQGTSQDLKNGSCEIHNGDSFINTFSVKTTSYVSDRVGVRDSNKSISPTFEFGGGAANLPFIGGFASRMFSTVGAEKCGTIPEQGAAAADLDPRANNDLNGLGGTVRDAYFPHVQKTLITFPVESDVNLYYRGSGDEDYKAHYRDLNGLRLDSSFGGGEGGYSDSYLDKFWATMHEIAPGKMLLRVLINFIFTYVIGWGMVIGGFIRGAITLENLQAGATNNIAAGFALVTSILMVVFGIAWLLIWPNTNLDNKFWDSILRIKDCFPDRFLEGDKYAMKDERVQWDDEQKRKFKDEYYKYEYQSYSRINNFDYNYAMQSGYNTCPCLGDKTYQILYSAKQDPRSYKDAYRNFLVNDYIEIPNHTGRMTDMFIMGNKMYVHTTDTIWSLESGSTTMKAANDAEIYLGRGDVLQLPINIYGGPSEGFAGNLDPNAAITSRWGHIWIDREAKTINMYSQSGYKELGGATVRNFLKENLGFKLLEQYPEFDLVDEKSPYGIGYSLGIDHRHNRLLITKIDYALKDEFEIEEFTNSGCIIGGDEVDIGDPYYFDNHSWTISYSFLIENYVSFHSYQPLLYAWDRNRMFSFDEGMWEHNVNGSFRSFYGDEYPFMVHLIATDPAYLDNFEYQNTHLYTESSIYDGKEFVSDNFTFDDVIIYDKYQSTGELDLTLREGEDALGTTKDYTYSNLMPMSLLGQDIWRFHEIRNKVSDKSVRILNPFNGDIPVSSNENNISEVNEDDRSFLDNYFGYIFSYKGDAKNKLLLKSVITNLDTENS